MVDHQLQVEFAVILDRLSLLDLEDHLEEVVRNICLENSWRDGDPGDVASWSVTTVCSWIKQLKLGSEDDSSDIARCLELGCVDGYTLIHLSEHDWVEELKLKYSVYHIIRTIMHGWKFKLQLPRLPRGVSSFGVACGVVTNLEHCSPFSAMKMVQVDSDCAEYGVGGVYGQLTAIGCKECQAKKGDVTPIGLSNDTYVLKRRKVANGTAESGMVMFDASDSSATQKRIVLKLPTAAAGAKPGFPGSPPMAAEDMHEPVALQLTVNPLIDVFHIGRAHNGGNDFVVPGVLHVNDEGCAAGPVSRWACRVECERLPPFRSFIYAGGFDPLTQTLEASKCFLPPAGNCSDLLQGIDGFTTFGVRVYQPEVGQWLEVSVRGRTYQPRRQIADTPLLRAHTTLGNQLTDGTVIALGGVCLIYRSPIAMAQNPEIDPSSVVSLLNSLKPQCPVLFNEITFSYQDSQERLQLARGRAYDASALSAFVRGVQVPLADYSHICEENRPYVFPACGHIFAYHRSIEGRPCPLCRQEGPFVPVAFAFEPSLCSRMPTHVFNPCGHVASQAACEFWASMWVPARDVTAVGLVHICPYCASELVEPPYGAPYSRLCLQTESGQTWPSTPSASTGNPLSGGLQLVLSAEDEGVAAAYAHQAGDPSLADLVRSQQRLFRMEHRTLQAAVAAATWDVEAYSAQGRQAQRALHRRSFPKYAPQLQK